jgi:hypothetical protein
MNGPNPAVFSKLASVIRSWTETKIFWSKIHQRIYGNEKLVLLDLSEIFQIKIPNFILVPIMSRVSFEKNVSFISAALPNAKVFQGNPSSSAAYRQINSRVCVCDHPPNYTDYSYKQNCSKTIAARKKRNCSSANNEGGALRNVTMLAIVAEKWKEAARALSLPGVSLLIMSICECVPHVAQHTPARIAHFHLSHRAIKGQ